MESRGSPGLEGPGILEQLGGLSPSHFMPPGPPSPPPGLPLDSMAVRRATASEKHSHPQLQPPGIGPNFDPSASVQLRLRPGRSGHLGSRRRFCSGRVPEQEDPGYRGGPRRSQEEPRRVQEEPRDSSRPQEATSPIKGFLLPKPL